MLDKNINDRAFNESNAFTDILSITSNMNEIRCEQYEETFDIHTKENLKAAFDD